MGFNEFYNNLKSKFEETSDFSCLIGKNESFIWPDSSGVYVIWENIIENQKKLIYIGMTGKFQKNSNDLLIFNNSSFKSRTNRWTPYRFCETTKDNDMKFHFRFGPKESKTSLQGQIKHEKDAYKFAIPYTKIEIHCFNINDNHSEYSPILFESLLLTKYLKIKGELPPANNSL
ncbi:MAG: hypothetical protein KBC58_00495 [Flavobacterium sp.]|nr:hypothetical protein [Flavobacterium sp.]